MRAHVLAACFSCLLAACAGPEPEPEGAMVPVAELPDAYRAALAAYGRGGDDWELEREAVLADPKLARFVVDNLIIELVRAHELTGSLDGKRALAALTRARAELVRLQDHSTPVLIELFEVSDGIVATLAGETLVEIGRPATVQATDLLFSDSQRTQRRAAVLFRSLPHAGKGEDRVRRGLLALSESEDWFVRAEAALSLGERGGRDRQTEEVRIRLGQMLFDEDPAVAEYAARGLGALDDPEGVLALIAGLRRAVGEGEVRLMEACQASLERLTGVSEGDIAGWERRWRHYTGADR